MSPQGYKNMDLESQDPIFNANLGQDENLIWTIKLRGSHTIRNKITYTAPHQIIHSSQERTINFFLQ